MRVVLDTNVVVSVSLSPSGPSFQVIGLADRKSIELWASPAILAEYEDVLYRPRIGIAPKQAKVMLTWLKATCEMLTPTKAVSASPDPKYNMFLECAEAAKAHYLVTGNDRDFPKRWRYTKVATPREFLDLFGTMPARIHR